MKWALTDFNPNYDQNYKNLPFIGANDWGGFQNTAEYLNTLFKEDIKDVIFEFKKENWFEKKNASIEITWTKSKALLYTKRYVIGFDEKLNLYFGFFIERHDNLLNGQTFTLELIIDEWIALANDPKTTLDDILQNSRLVRGHTNAKEIFDKEIGITGTKKIKKITPLLKNAINETYNWINESNWLVVFEKTATTTNRIKKISQGKSWIEPYKVYIAPLNGLDVRGEEEHEEIWNGDLNIKIGGTSLYDAKNNVWTWPKNEYMFAPQIIPLDKPATKVYELAYNCVKDYDTIGTAKTSPQKTLIEVEQLKEGEKKIILLNAKNSNAEEINKQVLLNGGVYNEGIEVQYWGFTSGNSHINYNILAIQVDNNILTFTTPSMDEILEVFPKAFSTTNEPYERPTSFNDLISSSNYSTPLLDWDGLGNDYIIYLEIKTIYNFDSAYWAPNTLFDYYADGEKGANVISARITNYNPIKTTQERGVLNLKDESLNITKDEENDIYILDFIDYDFSKIVNRYEINFGSRLEEEKLNGLNPLSFAIENTKEFNLDINNFDEENNYSFVHFASFTPQWEERIKTNSIQTLTHENNFWNNNKEFIKGIDQFGQYLATNPVSSQVRFLSLLINPIKQGLMGSILRGVGGGLAGLGEGLLDTIGGVLGFENMKATPDSLSGSGDIFGDLIFNYFGTKFILIESEFVGNSRNSILENYFRDGYNFESGFFVKKYEEIKRTNFNFLQLNMDDFIINEGNFLDLEGIKNIFKNGVRIWNKKDTFLDYESGN